MTRARIAALVVIAVLVGGLAYLRFAPDDTVSVPAGAKAGELTLKSCDVATEDGSYAADCGTLVVPENRADPRSRLIALPVTRIRARSAHSREPIFRLEGGPGLSNETFEQASRFAGNRDVVLVGYRGVDGSSVLDCPEVESALKGSADLLADETLRGYAGAFRSCSERLQDDGVDLAGYTLPQRVDDLEAARVALGYDRIDLLSESAGTRTAMIYAWRYPRRIHRSVMIGVNPPGHFLWDPQETDAQLRHYADLCARDDSCRDRTDDLAASMRRTVDDMPERWLFLPIKRGNARLAAFFGLVDSTSEAAPLSAPITLDAWLSAADGDPSGLWFASLLADLAFPEAFVWGDVAAVSRIDVGRAREHFASGAQRDSILGNPGTEFLWAGGRLADAWPANPSDNANSRVRRSDVETLLIGGTVDFATPPRFARDELLPYLPNGRQVVLAELGHTTDFWEYQPSAAARLINTFFDTGAVDDSAYRHRPMDFATEVTQTALAKGFLGTMAGFAIVALVSLAWMPRRVRKRGSFGRKASAALRSAYALVLGFGGWFLATLLVMTLSLDVALDNAVLAVLSVGVPIGLGVYWAWVHRDSTDRDKRIGFAAAAAGALVGAWLGFTSTTGLPALITTIIGAAVGANLALLYLDIARERSRRKAVPAEPPPPAPSTRELVATEAER